MEFRQLLLQIAVAGVVVSCIGNISGVCAQTTGFLYIDCGATTGRVDPVTGITWVPDADYISTGAIYSNVPQASNHPTFAELGTLRYFDSGRAKNCYTLPVTRNATYLLRLSFYHGSYDGASSVSFQVGVDASDLLNMSISNISVHQFRELTIQPQRNVTFVCLMPGASNGHPFISGISLRAVSVLPTRIKTLLAENEVIFTPRRFYFGPSVPIIRYPDDIHDRLWLPTSINSPRVSSTALITELTASGSVSIGKIPSSLDPPLAVLKTAITTSGNLTISLPSATDIPSSFLAMYFVELDPTANITDRMFMIDVSDPTIDDSYENPRNYSGPASGDYWTWSSFAIKTDASVVMYPLPSRTSSKGPIISAMEHSYSLGKAALPTNIRDVAAIEAIKRGLNLTDWSGDPCLPYPYAWLNCSVSASTNESSIVAVYLSAYNLSGTIPSAFAELNQLTTLALDHNYLKGSFPDLSQLKNLQKLHLQNNALSGSLPTWLTTMPNLRELYVQNNNFSGPIPTGLLSSNNLDFRYLEGNKGLGTGVSELSGKGGNKLNIGVIIGAVVGGLVANLLLLLACIFAYYRCLRKPKQTETPQPPDLPAGPKVRGARLFTFQEIAKATGNLKDEIGKGGFGSVYYGKLPDGQEIAVKVLKKTSVQGAAEFCNEVEILSRVHHRNLVTMVGYCEANDSPMLVYEFVHNGSLYDHLSGEKSFGPKKLDWRMRVGIALNAAQGLEYLHTSCNPSLIHRDVKSSNVLLTTKLEAKIADFGMSRLVKEQEATRFMTQVKGTPGYLDPEYFLTNRLSPKSDVFSFGVVLLELITGRLPIDPSTHEANLCDWVRHNVQGGNIDVILDPVVGASKNSYDSLWKVAETAMKCVEPLSVHRPGMTEVVQELQEALKMETSFFNSANSSDFSSGLKRMPPSMPEAR